jgi:glucokinase
MHQNHAILTRMNYFLAIDIGGTKTRIACFPQEGEQPIKINRIDTKFGEKPVLERLIDLIESTWPDHGSVLGIGVAAPGPIDPYEGIIIEAPNIPEWENLPLKEILEERFKVRVKLGNDANLAALGEWKFGAGRGHKHLIYITVSTGIGGGVISDNHLLLGVRGLAAELGHITILPDGPECSCGLRGHLEALSSGPAISKWVENELKKGTPSILSKDSNLSAKEIAIAARSGDKLAQSGFERAGKYLGLALTNFLHIFNPSVIILGGGVSQSGALLIEPLHKSLQEYILSPMYLKDFTLTLSQLEDDVGLFGALALLRTQIT